MFGRIGYALRFGRNADCKTARHVYTDVLFTQRIRQVTLDGDGRKVEESIILEHGPDERRPTVDATCRADAALFVTTYFPVND